jgi:sugar/nucleoside kinase (ribokinase family)
VKIAFIGHLCKDVNVVQGKVHTLAGGGVVHGAITAKRLGAQAAVYTKCAPEDQPAFGELGRAGVEMVYLKSQTTTSIRNEYPTSSAADRISTLLSRAGSFEAEEIESIEADVVHLNPLWFGEFPPELLPVLRRRAPLLGVDAQGFLRRPAENGRLVHQGWPGMEAHLPLIDLLKVDEREASALTGLDDVRAAARRLCELGARTVLLTHQAGVCVCDGAQICQSPFISSTLEGRTGRGDTCTAAFLVARHQLGLGPAEAAGFAARITSKKMMYRGPYRGED